MNLTHENNFYRFSVLVPSTDYNDIDDHGGIKSINWYCGPDRANCVNVFEDGNYPSMTSDNQYDNAFFNEVFI